MVDNDREIIAFLMKYRGFTIKQAKRLFFSDYSYTQKRLRLLEKRELIKGYFNKIINQKVYTLQDKISTHDLYVIELYSRLVELGCDVTEFKAAHRLYKDQLRPDGYISFIYKNQMYFYLIEIEDTHYTSFDKFQIYEMYYKTGELQEKCKGVFPAIILLGFNPLQYESHNFDTIYLDFKDLEQDSFIEKLL